MSIGVYQMNNRLVVQVPMPGFRPEDIDVTIFGETLSIKAQRQEEQDVEDGSRILRQVAFESSQRQVELPSGVDTDSLNASYHLGVLEVSFSRTGEEGRHE